MTLALLLLTAAGGSAQARARRRPPVAVERVAPARPGPDEGRVEFVTDRRAYLDHGTDGGLAAGQAVSLLRGGRSAGSCTVEAIAVHTAACQGGRPRVGDTFRIVRAPVPARAAVAPSPVVDDEALQGDARALADAEVTKVDFGGRATFGSGQTASLGIGDAYWSGGADPDTRYGQQRVDGVLRVRLGDTGLRLDAAFSAMRWQPRPEQTRFRPEQATQFYLWEAEVSRRDGDARTVAAVGRLWPWHTPGLGLLDGFQLGRRSEDQGSEWGIYGGLLPDVVTVAPAADAWTGGLYAGLTQTGARTDLVRLVREEARLGVRHVPAAGVVGEAEAQAQAWLGAWTVGGGGRAVLAPHVQGRPSVDRAFVEVRSPPAAAAGAGLHLRYFGPAVDTQEAALRAVTPALQGGYHADGDAHWDVVPWLGVGVTGDLAHDGDAQVTEHDGALELRLPRLLGDVGGLWLGGELAGGWLTSRTVYGQLLGHVRERLRFLARVSATASEAAAANLGSTEEVDGFLQLDAVVASWLRVRGRAMVRASLLPDGTRDPLGLVLGLDLAGGF